MIMVIINTISDETFIDNVSLLPLNSRSVVKVSPQIMLFCLLFLLYRFRVYYEIYFLILEY